MIDQAGYQGQSIKNCSRQKFSLQTKTFITIFINSYASALFNEFFLFRLFINFHFPIISTKLWNYHFHYIQKIREILLHKSAKLISTLRDPSRKVGGVSAKSM